MRFRRLLDGPDQVKEYEKIGYEQMKKAYATHTVICDYIWGWREGFLKAREMALNIENIHWIDSAIHSELETLGEKEV